MRSFFTHNTMDMHLLNDEYVIENDIDDSKFSADAHPLFNGCSGQLILATSL